ncbi:hypothetical protein [Vibrio metschnikovii]|uniref:hypothetical protein n=1 Tax=Vibrio metschnikovii TaxID=28172 RepID=UPI001C309E7C|nr:hypothetical protein [Vibrio metschnikovii]
MKSIFNVNHRIPIYKNFSFKVCLLVPLGFGVILGAFVWFPLKLSMTVEGFQYFLEISRLPLGIMGLTFPSVGVYVVHYKSKQSSEIVLLDKIQKLDVIKYKYTDSLHALCVIISRIRNHIGYLDHNLNKLSFSDEKFNLEFNSVYETWNNIFKDSLYATALSRLYSDLEKADSYFSGISLIISCNKRDFFKSGMFTPIVAELDLIYLKALRDFSHCKCDFLQNKYDMYILHGMSASDIKSDYENEYEIWQKHNEDIIELEGIK